MAAPPARAAQIARIECLPPEASPLVLPFTQRRRRLLAALAAASAAPSLFAQATPAAIKLVVPAPAGGSADSLGRLVADALSEILEIPVRVENIAGDGGVTG